MANTLWSGAVALTIVLTLLTWSADGVTLTILHTNDVHSRFLETNRYSGGCSEEEKAKKECFGGFSRLHYKVNEIRRTHPNVVYLSGGDYFQGTVWYTLYKWQLVAQFVNEFQHTAMAFGNHEFDDGVDGLLPFVNNVTFPLVSANIDASKEPRLAGKFKKSIVKEYEGKKVGIIGYTTTETLDISKPGNLIFTDEVKAVTAEAKRLHEEGVKIIIAVGHAGYDVDMKVATAPHVDVVVGGHTNTFLYSGAKPDVEEIVGPYPTVVTTKEGRRVPVVQAYAFGKYLGYLNVTFDDAGKATNWTGNPILLDGKVPQDAKMEAELLIAGEEVVNSSRKEVGKTRVFLDGSTMTCRLVECNLGNLVADAMVHMHVQFADDEHWSQVSLAFMHGGGVRSSIDEIARKGVISLEDILTVFPFQNTIDLVEVKGKILKEAFEFSVKDYDPKGFHLAGKFMQVSGFKVTYDIRKPEGHRVIELLALCSKCRVPKYEPVEDDLVYLVAMPTYLAQGGDGYKMIANNRENYHRSGILDTDMLMEYIQRRSPITQGLEGRIKIINEGDAVPECNSATARQMSLVALLLTITASITLTAT